MATSYVRRESELILSETARPAVTNGAPWVKSTYHALINNHTMTDVLLEEKGKIPLIPKIPGAEYALNIIDTPGTADQERVVFFLRTTEHPNATLIRFLTRYNYFPVRNEQVMVIFALVEGTPVAGICYMHALDTAETLLEENGVALKHEETSPF